LSEDSVARHRRRYTVEFFNQLLEDARILMQFHPGIFEVGVADDGTNRLVFKKIHIPDKAEAIKFRISFDFGQELAEQLGFQVPQNDPMFSFTWSPLSGAKNHALTDELVEDGDEGEDDQTVRTKVAGMRVALKNLEGPYPPLEQMRVQHLAMVEELENQKRLAADAAARPRTPPPRTPSPDVIQKQKQKQKQNQNQKQNQKIFLSRQLKNISQKKQKQKQNKQKKSKQEKKKRKKKNLRSKIHMKLSEYPIQLLDEPDNLKL
jgi:hypothetical protein